MTHTTKFELGKYGPKQDPTGAQVTMEWQGAKLLGDVVGFYRREFPAGLMLKVNHFNGEPWPVDPGMLTVDVLVRR